MPKIKTPPTRSQHIISLVTAAEKRAIDRAAAADDRSTSSWARIVLLQAVEDAKRPRRSRR